MMAVSFSPSAASTSSNTALAAGKVSASALPIPTAWEPCPGKVNAAVIGAPESRCKSPKFGRKTPMRVALSSAGPSTTRPFRLRRAGKPASIDPSKYGEKGSKSDRRHANLTLTEIGGRF